MSRRKRRIYCWIRQQRCAIAIHKFIYYALSDSIFEDLQFDYLEARLNAIENRYPSIALSVTTDGYLSPSSYVDMLQSPEIERRARKILLYWNESGRPKMTHVPSMSQHIDNRDMCMDALMSIARYPV